MAMTYGRIPGVPQPVSRLILGTMIIHTERLEESFALLDNACDLGLTALDTALVYSGGNSERAIGQWLAARGNRERVVIITKGGHPNADRRRVTPFDLLADFHDSLARLKTDMIDVYMLHRDDPTQPVGPLVEQFNRLLAEGKLRAFGASNWTHQRIAEANAYARDNGLTGMAVSSPHYSLAEQVDDPWGPGCVGIGGPAQAEARAWYERTQVAVLPYSSLARGFFSGRVRSSHTVAELQTAGLVDGACLRAYCHDVNLLRLARAEQLAAQFGVSVAQIALAYLMHQPLNLFPLVGAANRDEIEKNVAALSLTLTPAQVAWLDLRADSPENA